MVPNDDRTLSRRIAGGSGGFLLFGLTPPRQTTPAEDRQRIADTTLGRLGPLGLDGLILYDIDDEADRNPASRPFPYLPTVDPAEYLSENLSAWQGPVVVYRSVEKYPEDRLDDWLAAQDPDRVLSVFVGSSSAQRPVLTTLPRAQEVWSQRPEVLLGGVAIPERHLARAEEHERLLAKQARGCSFFVTQVVYDTNAARDLVSDYHYACVARSLAPVPIVFTLSVCGSLKTLEFLEWLGVKVPRWMANELRNAHDTLSASFDQCVATARDLSAFCRDLGIPFGFNVESVSIRRQEIEAAVRLAAVLRGILDE